MALMNIKINNKKYLFLIFVIFGLIFIISCSKSNDQIEQPILTSTQSKQLDFCNNFEDTLFKDKCILNFALEDDNRDWCSFITDKNIIDSCIQIINKNPKACENIPLKLKNDCYAELAYRLEDLSFCEKLSSEENLQFPAIFVEMASDTEYCKRRIAAKINDIAICNEFEEGERGSDSKDLCIKDVAVEKLEMDHCSKISNSFFQKYCLEDIITKEIINSLDYERCNEIFDDNRREDCYEGIALKKNDYTICKFSTGKKYSCVLQHEFLIQGMDVNICENKELFDTTFSTAARDQCYSAMALYRKDVSLCEKVSRPDVCIDNIATMYS